jgi:Ras-related protein Rab-32
MTRVYYKEAVGAFVVFDVTRVNTFEAVQKWKNDIDNKVTLPPDDRPIPVVLLANKVRLLLHYPPPQTSLAQFLIMEDFDV